MFLPLITLAFSLTAYPNRAILFAILNLGSAQNPHVLRVRSGFSALSVFKLSATITPIEIGSKFNHYEISYFTFT
ncbi:unnamed protein product [Photorhabdus laumondii subsp. laumondii TTO1]|uniref:Photorhabdus luminescens subsp. laumondii TTO1 complete genome segment 15/17 n=1 Tax=Photorhabdus laumondii subsp. laumondii (strain DSM 15139 / CIP 105565 / TT01) TaxID=243265 RepID=Q7MZ67_PHOLL|nr:unnamed protein product [Photorhabdus laumondii subsp. laumondii TTO1]